MSKLCELLELLKWTISSQAQKWEGSETKKLNNPEGIPVGDRMLNKDKRSLLLSLALGDGCLHYIRNAGKLYGGLTIDHGIAQSDYQSWKAKLLSSIFEKEVKMRTGHKGKSVQVSVCLKRIRAWRKFTYPNNKKSIPKILNFVRHPEFALSVWLMDDGYVEPGMYNKKLTSITLRLFVCDQNEQELKLIQEWLKTNFDIESRVLYQNSKGKKYPFIKINQSDSLKVWGKIRDFALQFKSMKHKFRYIEQIYQLQFLKRTTNESLKI